MKMPHFSTDVYKLTEPIAGFPAGPQPVFLSQRRLGLPPLRGRMRRGYFQCARALCWGLVAGLARFFHQRREAFLRVFV